MQRQYEPVEHLHGAYDHGKEGRIEGSERQEEGEDLERDDAVDREEKEHVDLLRRYDRLEPPHAACASGLNRVVDHGRHEARRVLRHLQHGQ